MVAGGFELMSYTTLLTPFTLFIISFDTFCKNLYGKSTQSAVIPSVLSTARNATTFSYVRSSPMTPTEFTGNKIAPACHTLSYKFQARNPSIKTASTSCNIFSFSAVISTNILIAKPGPGNG